ncbi:MAG: AAA family ATPase [Halieaceae bacterium]|nr:AAA family ATPase [Halieaceae bacterium]
MRSKNIPVYFTKLELENIRSFGEMQFLDLLDSEGQPAQWTLILGDNGVGKTTLLQCLTRMRPCFNEEPDHEDGPPPNPVEPELSQEEDNAVLKGLTRSGTEGIAKIRANLIAGEAFNGADQRGKVPITTFIKIARSGDNIEDVHTGGEVAGEISLVEPLVLAYGAGRHMGASNLEHWSTIGPTASLFDTAAELFDAEEILYTLDYLRMKGRSNERILLDNLKRLLAEILPALNNTEEIDIRGPRLPGSKEEDGGVWVNTPSGPVQFTQLSLGYQTVTALTADIAWRMLYRYPDSKNPLLEPAVVIVDEVDLHLHPQWQRTIRKHLIRHFPAVQFIATAHSPLMAQDALDTNLAVIRERDGQTVIESEPNVVKTWRLDQILTSGLFNFESARPVEVENAMKRRIALVQKGDLTEDEQNELAKLDSLVLGLPTAELDEDRLAMEIVRKAAALLSS